MQPSIDPTRRDLLKTAGLVAVAGLWSDELFQRLAAADEKKPATDAAAIGRRELIKGLDGMSRVADEGHDLFVGGHNAAAVLASAFFCRQEKLDEATQKEIVSLLEARLLTNAIFAPRPKESADPELIAGLVKDLDAGIDTLRRAGHNIIFTVVSLKALQEIPEAVTPERVNGLRKMVQRFGTMRTGNVALQNKETFVDLRDEKKFIRFIFEEYLKALELYLNGKGHHGYAGHILTAGHALIELVRMGYKDTAHKGIEAYWQFVQLARNGANLGGKKLADAPPQAPTPLARDYWVGQGKRRTGEIVSSHVIKYPYSFYALAKELQDEALKQRILEKIFHLTAVS
jgi:hypothetical protein